MRCLWRLTRSEIRLFFRNKIALFFMLLFPFLMIVLFGSMFKGKPIHGTSYVDAYIPSWIAVNLFMTAMFTVGTALASYRESGILRRYQVTPIRSWKIVVSQAITGVLVFGLSVLILVGLGCFIYDLSLPKYWGSTFLAIGLSILALYPFGLFVTSIAKNARTAAAITSLLMYLMMFLSGATFPVQLMPEFLQVVAKMLPLYYVVDLLRKTWSHSVIWQHPTHLCVLLGLFVVFSILSTRYFRWTSE